MRYRSFAPIALLAATAHGAQSPPVVTLSGAAAELPQPFLEISAIAELSNGQLVVADGSDDTVWLADFTTRRATRLGRKGDGPREYRSIWSLFLRSHDSVLVDDPRNRRLVVFAGGQLTSKPLMLEVRATNTNIRAIDRQGRVYSQGPTFGHDSVPIMRWDATTRRLDTLAYAMTRDPGAKDVRQTGTQMEMSVIVSTAHPAPADLWTVLDDGTVLIARVADYHVESVSPAGRRTVGAAVAFERIAIPDSLRKGPLALSAKYWPPFRSEWQQTATASRDGTFWVRRTTKGDSDAERYDVFSRNALLIMQVVLPRNAHLVGFGAGHVYVARIDADGGQHVQQFMTPRASR